jgi:hypothetical protein
VLADRNMVFSQLARYDPYPLFGVGVFDPKQVDRETLAELPVDPGDEFTDITGAGAPPRSIIRCTSIWARASS